jgi:hypothetical protein
MFKTGLVLFAIIILMGVAVASSKAQVAAKNSDTPLNSKKEALVFLMVYRAMA